MDIKSQMEMLDRFSEEEKNKADNQIESFYKKYDYDIREFPLEVVYDKFTKLDEDGVTEWFIPVYQRMHIWNELQQSRFIESLLINLPIPYLFVSETDKDASTEIVDGSQRVRTVARFVNNDLELSGLTKLTLLNGYKFSDLSKVTKRRLLKKTLRTIDLQYMDEESRRELFNRLNTGGTKLSDSEKRYGVRDGNFFELVKELAQNEVFHELCPISKKKADRREYEEFTLRFFAYSNAREKFTHSVEEFLDMYLDDMNDQAFDEAQYRKQFHGMLDFAKKHFENGFRKSPKNTSVPRIRFEALSVGIVEALKVNPNLIPSDTSWIYSDEKFLWLVTSDASNSRPKANERINFVKRKLLGECL